VTIGSSAMPLVLSEILFKCFGKIGATQESLERIASAAPGSSDSTIWARFILFFAGRDPKKIPGDSAYENIFFTTASAASLFFGKAVMLILMWKQSPESVKAYSPESSFFLSRRM
jgi:hypothetical protein